MTNIQIPFKTRSVIDLVNGVAEARVPMQKHKSPETAALWGFFLGGIGLAIYLESVMDFVIPVLIWLGLGILGLPLLELPLLTAPFFCAYYGYARAKASNEHVFAYRPTAPMNFAHATVMEPPIIPKTVEVVTPRLIPPPVPPPTPAQSPISQKLRLINELKQAGHMSELEYDEKRRELIGSI